MSEYLLCAIRIGGAVPRALAGQLAEKITDAGMSLEWGGPTSAPACADDLEPDDVGREGPDGVLCKTCLARR